MKTPLNNIKCLGRAFFCIGFQLRPFTFSLRQMVRRRISFFAAAGFTCRCSSLGPGHHMLEAKIVCWPLSPSDRQNPGSQDKLPTALKYVGFRKLRETLQRVCICCYIILSLSLVVLCWPDLSLSPSSRTTSSLSSPRKWYDLSNSAAVRISKAT